MEKNRSGQETARVYFALWPGAAVRQRLRAVVRDYQALCGGRSMRAGTLHLTLLFIGAVPRRKLPALMQAAARIFVPALQLELRQFACWQHKRIGYAAPLEAPAGLEALVEALRQAVADAGFAFDQRPFVPHVTLLRNIRQGIEPQAFPPVAWPVDDFVLVESQRSEQGAHYEILGRWPLRR